MTVDPRSPCVVGVAQSIWYRFSSVKDSQCEVRIMQDGSV